MSESTQTKTSVKTWLVFALICLTNITVVGDNFIIPIVNSIYMAFPEDELVVNFILTGPLLLGMIAGLVAGKILEFASKKLVLIICLTVYMLAAGFGAAIDNVMYMAVLRAIVGFATGVVPVTSMALVSDMFPDENVRARAMGFFAASMGILAAIASAVAGVVGATGVWQDVFKLFWVTLPVIVLVLIFLPNEGKGASSAEASAQVEESAGKTHEKVDYKPLLALCGSILVFVCLYSVPFMQISVYISEMAIGDEILSGTSASIVSVASFLGSTVFGVVYAKINRTSITISYALLFVVNILFYLFPSAGIVLFCSALMGFTYGIASAYFMTRATVIAPPSKTPFFLACQNAALSLGSFLSTYLVSALSAATGIDTLAGLFGIFAGVYAVGFVLSLILNVRSRKVESGAAQPEA